MPLAILILAAGGLWGAQAARQATSHRRGRFIPLAERRSACQKLCSKYIYESSERRECLVDCRVRTDLAHSHGEESLRDFADSQLGAQEEAKAYRKMLGQKECKPLVNVGEIEFKDVDLNDDGSIVPSELVTVGSLLCIPGRLTRKLFTDLDTDSDRRITLAEWRKAGEDTVYEYEVDKVVDQRPVTRREATVSSMAARAVQELLAEVHAPDFQVLDADGDGFLNDWELLSGCMRELVQRDPTMSRAMRRHMMEVLGRGIGDAVKMIDSDHDGLVSPSEYAAVKADNDLGDELREYARNLFAGSKPREPSKKEGARPSSASREGREEEAARSTTAPPQEGREDPEEEAAHDADDPPQEQREEREEQEPQEPEMEPRANPVKAHLLLSLRGRP